MRKLNLLLAAAAAATLGAGAASAQAWLPIIEREPVMEARIDARLSSGDISAAEAANLRADLRALVALEGRYRWGGLTARERLDLDRQYGMLDDRLRLAVRDGAPDRLASLADRKLRLEARIDQGVRSGQLTGAEAADLRDELADLNRLEARYRIDGMTAGERVDLSRRMDALSEHIRLARADSDRVYGYNTYPPY